jgi:hypothetical protein
MSNEILNQNCYSSNLKIQLMNEKSLFLIIRA